MPPTPVVVPPTPVGGQRKEEKGGRDRGEVDVGKVVGDGAVNGKEDGNNERPRNVNGTVEYEDVDEAEDGAEDIIIVQSPEDELEDCSIKPKADSVSTPKPETKDLDKTPQPRSPTSPKDSNKPRQNADGKKSPIPTGRSRSRSSSSSSQCTSSPTSEKRFANGLMSQYLAWHRDARKGRRHRK